MYSKVDARSDVKRPLTLSHHDNHRWLRNSCLSLEDSGRFIPGVNYSMLASADTWLCGAVPAICEDRIGETELALPANNNKALQAGTVTKVRICRVKPYTDQYRLCI